MAKVGNLNLLDEPANGHRVKHQTGDLTNQDRDRLGSLDILGQKKGPLLGIGQHMSYAFW